MVGREGHSYGRPLGSYTLTRHENGNAKQMTFNGRIHQTIKPCGKRADMTH